MSRHRHQPAPDALPEPIVRSLRSLIRRARTVIAVRGLAATAALALAALLAIMAVDAGVVIFSARVRYALSLAGLAVAVAGAAWFLVRPLARSMTLAGVARAIEAHHPELQERISSAVELLGSRDAPESRGSEALIAALVERAAQDARTLRPTREITFRRARPVLLGALGLAALLSALLLAWPAQTSRLVLRAVAPHMNLPNLSGEDLIVTPGDVVVTRGKGVRVEVEVAGTPVRSARLRVPRPDGTERVEAMTRLFDPDETRRRFAFAFEPRESSFRYRIHAGDALSRYYTVQVVPFPAVAELEVRYDYPAYTGLRSDVEAPADGDITAVAGTEVTVTARTNTRLGRAEFFLDGRPREDVAVDLLDQDDGTSAVRLRFALEPGLSGRWRASFTDVYGFRNRPQEHDLKALPDRPPTARILEPGEKRLRLRPDDELPLAFAVGDDFGVAGAELLLHTEAGRLAPMPVRAAARGDDAAFAAGTTVLHLDALDLRGADRLTFRLRATDNLPPTLDGPQEGLSETYTILFERDALSYAEQVLRTWEQGIRSALEEVLAELEAAREESAAAAADVGRPHELGEEAQQQLADMLEHLDAAEGRARELAEQVAPTPFAGLSPRLEQVADEHIARAENLAGQVPLTEEPQERAELADEADFQAGMAAAAVEEMAEQFDAMAQMARRRQDLSELARSQAELAAALAAAQRGPEPAPGGLSPDPEQWAERQSTLADQVASALDSALSSALPESRARDLAGEARRLKARQEALTADTARLDRVRQLSDELDRLAEEQASLAGEAERDDLSAHQAGRMREAADDIRAEDLDQAVLKQRAVAGSLGGRAGGLRNELRTAEIADRAEKLAGEQQAVLQQAEAAAQDPTRLHDLSQKQQMLVGDFNQLKEQARQAGWRTNNTFNRHDPTGKMEHAARVAKEARSRPNDESRAEAVEAIQEAGQVTDALAAELREAVDGYHEMKDKEQRTDRLADLAERQRELEGRTRRAADERRKSAARLREGQLAHLQREQHALAREATRAAQRVERTAPDVAPTATEAARQAARAARRLDGGELPEAAAHAERAAQEMGQMAEPLVGEQGREARRLGRRQQSVAEQLRMFEQSQDRTQAGARQEELAARSADLMQDVDEVREQVEAVAPDERAGSAAARASGHVEQAESEQRRAGDSIAAGRPDGASGPQQESAAALEAAARSLEQVGKHLARAESPEAPEAGPPEAAPLAEALAAAREAASSMNAAPAEQAAGQLDAAGRHLARQAASMGLRAMALPVASPGGALPFGEPGGRRGPDTRNPPAPPLEEMEITLEDWMELPGHLRNDILQAAAEEGPEEYRLLIKRYFAAVARRGLGDGAEEGR
jgi:hypothetical protein